MNSVPEVEPLDVVRTWPAWLKRYERATAFHERLGLIGCGFAMEPVQDVDVTRRLIYYLNLADGFTSRESRHYNLPGDVIDKDVLQSMYAHESLKIAAFSELIQHFFLLERPKRLVESYIGWRDVLKSNTLLEQLLHFFRPETGSGAYERLENLPDWHDYFAKEQLLRVRKYLNTLVDGLFGIEIDFERRPRAIDLGNRAAQVVSILACQGVRFELLLDRHVTVTPQMLEQLEAIAYRGRRPSAAYPLKRIYHESGGAAQTAAKILLLK